MRRFAKSKALRRKNIANWSLRIVAILALVLLLVFILRFPQMDFFTRKMADTYCRDVFPYVYLLLSWWNSLFYFSVTEMIVVVGGISAFIFVIVKIISLIRLAIRDDRKALIRMWKWAKNCLIMACILGVVFQAAHGIAYKRTPAAKRLQIDTNRERSIEEVYAVMEWAFSNMVEARAELGEDFNGASHMSMNFYEAAEHADVLLGEVGDAFGLEMNFFPVNAKPVMLSSLWSQTHIVGVYDPFLGEANINVDNMMPISFPSTLCHEIAHVRGYAREYDANLIATLACICSNEPEFRYAGYHEIFLSMVALTGDISYMTTYAYTPVRIDTQAEYAYWLDVDNRWDALSRAINTVSEAANDAFLESNGQEGGTETYNVDTNCYVEFYYTYVSGGEI